jgi:hypothetical protein
LSDSSSESSSRTPSPSRSPSRNHSQRRRGRDRDDAGAVVMRHHARGRELVRSRSPPPPYEEDDNSPESYYVPTGNSGRGNKYQRRRQERDGDAFGLMVALGVIVALLLCLKR